MAATGLNDLVELVTSSGGSGSSAVQSYKVPSTETILASLQQRFKADLPWVNCGSSTLVGISPCKTLGDLSDASATAYERAAFWEQSINEGAALRPHPYEFAGRIFGALQRTGTSQAVVVRYLNASIALM